MTTKFQTSGWAGISTWAEILHVISPYDYSITILTEFIFLSFQLVAEEHAYFQTDLQVGVILECLLSAS